MEHGSAHDKPTGAHACTDVPFCSSESGLRAWRAVQVAAPRPACNLPVPVDVAFHMPLAARQKQAST